MSEAPIALPAARNTRREKSEDSGIRSSLDFAP